MMKIGHPGNFLNYSFYFGSMFPYFFCFFLISGLNLFSQTSDTDTLKTLRESVINAKDDSVRIRANDFFVSAFEKILASGESYKMNFDSLKQTGILLSPDNEFRMITWNLPFDDGTHKFFCYIQTHARKKKNYMVFKLRDKSEEITSPEKRNLSIDRWFGVLYYKIIPFLHKGKTYYTLLGWDGNNSLTSKKIIDVLYFAGNGEPKFGADVFFTGKASKKRVVFEFSARAVMSLKYHPERNQIVFDHLSPSQPELEGMFQHYGPDFSYDAYELEKGKWIYKEDVNIRSDTENPVYNPEMKNKDKPVYSPRE